MKALVLLAHGSRDPLWAKPIEAIAQAIKNNLTPTTQVCCAYLELMPPSLENIVLTLAQQGVQRIDICPLFLGMGKHAREDLPILVQAVQMQHPTLSLQLMPSIGEQTKVIQAIADFITKSLSGA